MLSLDLEIWSSRRSCQWRWIYIYSI